MFIARNSQHTLINLLNIEPDALAALTKSGPFFCQSCHTEVILKAGTVKVAHFAHKKQADCHSLSEGETAEHLAGKRLLANWCQKHQITYQMEAYLPALQQRPDLLVNRTLAIEFQCSPITAASFQKRTATYLKHGYQVIWLVGKQFWLAQRLTNQQRLFLKYQPTLGFYYWELDVEQSLLRCNYHLEQQIVRRQLVFHQVIFSSDTILDALTFSTRSSVKSMHQYNVYRGLQQQIKQFTRQLYYQESAIIQVQTYFYSHHANLRVCNLALFLPVTEPLFLRESVYYWRFFYWQLFRQQTSWTLENIEQAFIQALIENQLHVYPLPLIATEVLVANFVKEYTYTLMQVGLLSWTSTGIQMKRLPKAFESELARDEQVKRWQGFNQKSIVPNKIML